MNGTPPIHPPTAASSSAIPIANPIAITPTRAAAAIPGDHERGSATVGSPAVLAGRSLGGHDWEFESRSGLDGSQGPAQHVASSTRCLLNPRQRGVGTGKSPTCSHHSEASRQLRSPPTRPGTPAFRYSQGISLHNQLPRGWGQANLTGRDARSANLDHRGRLRGHRRGAGRHHHRPERGRAVAGGGGRASWSAPAADVYLSQPGPQRVGFQPHALPAPAQPAPVRSMQVGTAGAGSVYGVTGGAHTTFNSEAAGQSRTSFTASLAFSPACFTFADA